MSHGVYVCTECRTQLIPCKCPGPHHSIAVGLCTPCKTLGKTPNIKALRDVERLADFLMVNYQEEIRVGEQVVDMAIRILTQQKKAGPALEGNSAPQHGRMPGPPESRVK